MRITRKLGTLAATAALVVPALQVIAPAAPAFAWSGTLPSCGGAFPSYWLDALKSDPRFNENTGWIAFRREWSGSPFMGNPGLFVVWDQKSAQSSVYGPLTIEGGNGVIMGLKPAL